MIDNPDRMVMALDGINRRDCRILAIEALSRARLNAPKLSGTSARRMEAIWGTGWIGIRWLDQQVWFQERGVRPFTMTKLAGKLIPMWIDDPTGRERKANPKAKTRVTASGRTQVLIFRKAARIGARRNIKRKDAWVNVPASYPGAPGRIALREAPAPHTQVGKVGGRIAAGNIGVRWRHPGLHPRQFLEGGLREAAYAHGLVPGPIHAVTESWRGF